MFRPSRFIATFAIIVAGSLRGVARSAPPQANLPVPEFLTAEIISIFDPATLDVPDGHGFKAMGYRLFKPEIVKGNRYPLILYLNGHSRHQFDYPNVGQLKHLQDLVFHDPLKRDLYPFFVLAPQCMKNSKGNRLPWTGSQPARNSRVIDSLEAAVCILDQVIAEYPVDEQAITVLGISAGGSAAWELARRYPDRFAAIVPCGSFPFGFADAEIEKLCKTPIWAFHARGDRPETVRNLASQISSRSGRCHLAEIPEDHHHCWDTAFKEYDVLTWMLRQRLDASADADVWSRSMKWHSFKHDFLTPQAWGRFIQAAWPQTVLIIGISAVLVVRRRYC